MERFKWLGIRFCNVESIFHILLGRLIAVEFMRLVSYDMINVGPVVGICSNLKQAHMRWEYCGQGAFILPALDLWVSRFCVIDEVLWSVSWRMKEANQWPTMARYGGSFLRLNYEVSPRRELKYIFLLYVLLVCLWMWLKFRQCIAYNLVSNRP